MAQDDEAQIEELQRQRAAAKAARATLDTQRDATELDKAAFGSRTATFDSEIYGSGKSRFAGYDDSIDVSGGGDVDMDDAEDERPQRMLDSYTATKEQIHEYADPDAEDDAQAAMRARQIQDREGAYQKRRWDRGAGDMQNDSLSGHQAKSTLGSSTSYRERMLLNEAERERKEADMEKVKREREEREEARVRGQEILASEEDGDATPKKRRWDQAAMGGSPTNGDGALEEATNRASQMTWDAEAPAAKLQAVGDEAPRKRKSRWDQTQSTEAAGSTAITPVEPAPAPTKRSRWDQTPDNGPTQTAASIAVQAQSFMPTPQELAMMDPRSRFLTDTEIDQMLPMEGYEVIEPPPGYAPVTRPGQKLMETPVQSGFIMQDPDSAAGLAGMAPADLTTNIEGVGDLAFFKHDDAIYFAKVLEGEGADGQLSTEELRERKILRLLLKIKNGTPPMRKSALRQIADNARYFGAGPLFDKILPLLMERSLEDQERHLLVKVIDRILYKLDDLVRPYVHKILVVIEPLLIDEDYYARVEGREIISNLAKAAGLAHMISTMRPDIDHVDEYVRNTTARAFSVVASALGIPALLPFLRAVCRSKKSWQARHTGIKIVQQISIMMGVAVLPHLRNLIECIAHGLEDEQQKVRTMTALALAGLAEAAAPYGIESFDSVLKPLWTGIRKHRGKGLAAFLKAIGFIIPLMDAEYANYYTKEVMVILIREFQSPDEEMKKIVLKVIKQCSSTDGVTPEYVRNDIVPDFFRNFWVRRMALDKRNYRQVVETTVELANKAGVAEIIGRIVADLKDESEPYRKMVMETIQKVITALGSSDISERLEVQLIDGIIYAFQEQGIEDEVMLDGFGTVVNSLGERVKPYLTQIVSAILWRLNNKSAKVRQQAADLVTRLAVVIKQCQEDHLLSKLGVVLFEQLGEEYPDTLGSLINAEAAIANVVGMAQMNPPVKDLLPRMTPILRNRHEKVQEASINLIGRIADRGAEFVSAREWMRICFELLDLLKAHKKAIRRAAVNSFGYIAKAIGPQDVLSVLLTNLRVQERQSRVCSTIAIAIVAETTGPFTCIPAILAEYRTPDVNVQHGCLKALAFLFEYIGEMARDYIYAVTTLIEDALTDRDAVHRQTAGAIVKHITLGVAGLNKEDALLHMLNLIWPNVLESSPHVLNNMMEALEALSIGLGPGVVLAYTWPGLAHPARRIREAYWRIYNQTFMRHAGAMTPYYPRFESDSRNDYARTMLDLCVLLLAIP